MVERQAFGKKDFVLEEEGFPKTLREVFLAQLWRDTNPDVRARAATVIGSLEDPRAALALLNLIEDPQWFVRLHGVRALSKPRHTPLAAQIACRLTDSNWRVREAVAQTLVSLGQFHLLVEHLACGDDRYANEQIAEELERDGFMSKLLAHYALTAEARERKVVERLARMDKTSYIVAMLQNGAPPGMRERFLVDFGQHPDPQVRSWAARVAQTAALEVAAAVD
jgi:hypothetical protein